MTCPTCSAPLKGYGPDTHYCTRCGTLVIDYAVAVPSLVTRCRTYEPSAGSAVNGRTEWTRLGIPDAIGKKS